MSSVVVRSTRPVTNGHLHHQLATLLIAPQQSFSYRISSPHHFRPFSDRRQPLFQHHRAITTSSSSSQQAAQRRREQEDSDDNDDATPSAKEQPAQPAPPVPREPVNRTTVAASFLREPTPSTTRPKRKNSLDWLANAPKVGAAGASTPESRREPIQTDRRSPHDIAEELKKRGDISFLDTKRRPQQTQQGQTPNAENAGNASTTPRPGSGNTLQDILDNYRATSSQTPATRPPPSKSTSPSNWAARMLDPQRPAAYAYQSSDYLSHIPTPQSKLSQQDLLPPTFHISPALGRSVTVNNDRGIDVGRAFRMVEIRCSLNSVRTDLRDQRFHERPGLKRKRLRMSRWRQRFRDGFRETVRRVEELRRKGW